jgi:hypothetical protein
MAVGYPVSKNRVSVTISLVPEVATDLKEMAESDGSKIAPWVSNLIVQERQRREAEVPGGNDPSSTEQVA